MKLAFALACLLFASTSHAQSTHVDQAKWLLERLTGVKWPSDSPVLRQVADQIQAGKKLEAAEIATAQPQFIDVVVKEMASRMSTRDESVRVSLNDFTATIMGVTRDETDARELLYGNFLYKGDPALLSALTPAITANDVIRTNAHYEAIERANVSASSVLQRVNGQNIATSATAMIANPDPAGVLTSRAFLGAHAVAGTNRRLVEYTFRQFMCAPILNWGDTAASDVRIGRDVDRAPGGDNTRFLTTCKGCHTVMDGFRGAFAKWDYRDVGGGMAVATYVGSGATQNGYRPDVDQYGVMNKMNRETRDRFIMYEGGYVTRDDSFVNNANRVDSRNAMMFGWRGMAPDNDPALSGRTTGVHAFGRLVAGSTRFNSCMAKRVWDSVCKHELSDADRDAVMISLGMQFETMAFNMKKLFQQVAIHPKCKLGGA